ncbi:uncharacterized protein LOC107370505 isoform X1 [Tetranychus urticae]|uniref:uncharacterized protein LOC107370505 isoform X1 n=1 Tax=Tetranychus urticae TaxID=32264 RepID=UPI000D65B082|nr:uncharacterized protein LOC107370505 isoform X1 [Tetranychus urticae]
MKTTVGLIFLFSVINVAYSASLRELDFIKSLYSHEEIPMMVINYMVNRRIDQVKTLSEKNLILDNGKTFYNYTERSLNLFLESIYSNDNSELFERYSRIVQILSEGNKLLRIHSTDYLTVNSDTSFSRDELLAMIDAYIDDIEMVQKCEVPLGRPNRVDMKIVERIKSLFNELQNYIHHNDNIYIVESMDLSQKTMDQGLWQFEFLLNKFTTSFIQVKNGKIFNTSILPKKIFQKKSTAAQKYFISFNINTRREICLWPVTQGNEENLECNLGHTSPQIRMPSRMLPGG